MMTINTICHAIKIIIRLTDDNAASFRPVTVLSRRDDQTSVSGVEPGVRVVVQGAGFLSDGDKVTVSTGQPAAAPAAAAPAKK